MHGTIIKRGFMNKQWHGWLFLLPSLIGLVVMIFGPVIVVFFLGFTRYNILRPPQWIGIINYRAIFTDPLFWKVVFNTVYFAVVTGFISIVLGLALAVLVNSDIPGQSIFRTILFLPVIVSMVSAAFVWRWIFNSHFGVLNFLLENMGVAGPLWLDDTQYAMIAVIIMSVWKMVGYNMVIFLAGLKNIPLEYYQAAQIDGAGTLQKFFRITLPLLSPTTFFVIIVTLINAFLVFEQTYVMTNGGPANSTLTFALHIFNNAFLYFRMGYASALAFLFFLVILLLTYFQMAFQKKWVHYG